MALGDSNANAKGNRPFENTFYSRIRFRNNGMSLGFQFRSGLLVVTISEEKDNFQYTEVAKINLSPAKATTLRDLLVVFREKLQHGTIAPGEAYGVNSGLKETVSFIAFGVTGKISEAGIPQYCVNIGKVDANANRTEEAQFVFNIDYNYGLIWSNLDAFDVEKEVKDLLELDVFISTLNEFVNTASGAAGYSVFDIGRYELARMINPIYDKLGIERSSNKNNGSRGGEDNYFSNKNARSTNRSVDDLDDFM